MARAKKTTTYKTKADYPELIAAETRLGELRVELQDTTQKADELARLGAESNAREHIATRAEAMLAGDDGGAITKTDSRIELREARESVSVLTEAIKLQTKIVRDLAFDASCEISESQLPQKRELVEEIAKHVESLAEALEKIEPMRRKHLSEGGGDYRIALPEKLLPGQAGKHAINHWRRSVSAITGK